MLPVTQGAAIPKVQQSPGDWIIFDTAHNMIALILLPKFKDILYFVITYECHRQTDREKKTKHDLLLITQINFTLLNFQFICRVLSHKEINCALNQEFRNMCIFNPLNPELNPICYLLALLAHHFLHVSRIRVKSLTLRLLNSYIYIYIYIEREREREGERERAPILDVSRSHTTTQHSR